MKVNQYYFVGLGAVVIASSMVACQPPPAREINQPLTIQIPAFDVQPTSEGEVSEMAAPQLPSVVTDFDCVYINVMGEGITPDSTLYSSYTSIASSVSSLGTVALSKVSGPIYPSQGGTVTLTDITGTNRIVSVIGVKASSGCSSSYSAADLNNTTLIPFATELSRTSVDVLQTSTVNFKLDSTGYDSNIESRLNLKLAAPTFVSSSPSTSTIFEIPSSVVLTYSVNMAKPALSNFSISSSTCTTSPSISAVSATNAAITLTLSGGSCSAGQAFTIGWPGGLKNLSGVAGADSAHTVTLTFASPNKKIFITNSPVAPLMGASASAAVTAADAACAADANKPDSGTYKAMIAAGSARRACSSASCATSGVAENSNWVMSPNVTYYRLDATTVIGTTNASGVFTFPLTNSFDGSHSGLMTGLLTNWTAGDNCTDWTDNTSNFRTGYSSGTSSAAIDMGSGSVTPCSQPTKIICVQQ